MATLILVEGFEHGVASPTTNGGGLANTVNGTPTVSTTQKHTGSYALNATASGSAAAHNIVRTISSNIVVGTFWFYYTTESSSVKIFSTTVSAGAYPNLAYNATDNKIYAYWTNTQGNAANVTLTNGQWYRIDFKFDVSGGTGTIDFQVNGTAATQTTVTQAATTITSVQYGFVGVATGDCYWDDIAISATAADYPLLIAGVQAIVPTSDGTHNAGTVMTNTAGSVIDGTTVTAYTLIDDIPMSGTADYIRQAAGGAGNGNYAEVTFGDSSNTNFAGAMAYLAYMSAATQANNGQTDIIDEDATTTTVYDGDMSESSQFYKSVILPNPAGGWDQGAVNALKSRMGYSTDASPIPYWQALQIQVAYLEAAATNITAAEASQSQTSDAASVSFSAPPATYNITAAENSQAQTSDIGIVYSVYPIVGVENSQSQASDAAVARSIYAISAAENSQAQASDAVIITATHPISAAENTQSQVSDAASISFSAPAATYNITAAENSQSQSSDTALVYAVYPAIGAENNQSQVSDPVSVKAIYLITGVENSQGQTSDPAILTAVHLISAVENTQSQTSDTAVITTGAPATNITVAEASQAQASDAASITAIHRITAVENTQGQTSDSAVISVNGPIYNITPAENTQGQSSDIPTLWARYLITAMEAVQGQTSDAVSLQLLVAFTGIVALTVMGRDDGLTVELRPSDYNVPPRDTHLDAPGRDGLTVQTRPINLEVTR